jgi:hypothetical protein
MRISPTLESLEKGEILQYERRSTKHIQPSNWHGVFDFFGYSWFIIPDASPLDRPHYRFADCVSHRRFHSDQKQILPIVAPNPTIKAFGFTNLGQSAMHQTVNQVPVFSL